MKFYDNLRKYVFDTLWFKILTYCSIPFYIFLCLCYIEYMNYGQVRLVHALWVRNPGAFILAFSILIIISAILILLCRKTWIYAVVFGSVSVIVGIINCVKHAVNGDYFFPWDISMAGNMGQLISFARFDLPPYFWLLLPMIIIACVIYALSKTEIPVKWYIRVPPAIALSLIFVFLYNSPKTTERMLNKFNMTFNDNILQASNYYANGFVNAFAINCFALKVVEPEGYTQQQIQEYLSGYSNSSEITNTDDAPDVIVILSEAFFDITKLNNTEFSQDPLKNFREISARDNAYSGELISSALGGGTIRTEFEILTGLTVDYLTNGTSPYIYITENLETYVSNYKDQGYYTKAIHTYNRDFYMRDTAYPYLGFDEFVAEDEIAQREDAQWRRRYLTDQTLVNEITDTLDENTDNPNFIFAITMENHQSYGKTDPKDIVIEVKNDRLDSDTLDAVTTYTQGAYYADLSLASLVDYIDNREKETILLFFGDHLPTLGSNQSAYRQAGNIDQPESDPQQDRMFLYSTPFLFYSNYDIDYDATMQEHHYVSTYYMLSLLADMTGTQKTAYMNYLLDHYNDLPYYNVRVANPLTDAQAEFINSLKLITFDRVRGAGYSVSAKASVSSDDTNTKSSP